MKKGILYLACGDRKYLAWCACSALSLRWAGYTGPIRVLVDNLGFDESIFENANVEIFPVKIPCEGDFSSRWIKTKLPHYTPFAQTLYLDCDVIALRHPRSVWKALGNADFGMVRDPQTVATCNHATEAEFYHTLTVCPDSVQYNSGVMAWQTNEVTSHFFELWHQEWQRFQDIDQLALARALAKPLADEKKIALQELPLRFNIYGYETVLQAWSAKTVFWHVWKRADVVFAALFGPIYQEIFDKLCASRTQLNKND